MDKPISRREMVESMGFTITEFPDGHYEAECGSAWLCGLIEDLDKDNA